MSADDREYEEKDDNLSLEGNMDEAIDTQYMGGESVDDEQNNEDKEKFADDACNGGRGTCVAP